MGRNNICVIYDSDENYAKRLMSVINDDNDIPYNAQVFTKEHELDQYLQEKEADMTADTYIFQPVLFLPLN